MQLVGVFVHRKIQGAVDLEQSHIALHLGIVLRLGLIDVVLGKFAKRLVAHRFDFQHRP